MATPEPTGWRVPPAAVAGGTVAVLVAYNVVRATGLFGDAVDLANTVLLVVLVVAALTLRVPASALGTTRDAVGPGVRWGLGAMGIIAGVLAIAALVPATAGFLEDSRAEITAIQLGGEVVFGILIATVLPEEFAFRGLLLGASLERWSRRAAVVGTSMLFGLWHIAPTLSTMSGNATTADIATSPSGTVLVVVANVVATAVAGVIFAVLRLRSRSLLAPVLAHLGTNATALVTAWALTQ